MLRVRVKGGSYTIQVDEATAKQVIAAFAQYTGGTGAKGIGQEDWFLAFETVIALAWGPE